MDKLSPSGISHGPLARYSRQLVLGLALAASLTALAFTAYEYGWAGWAPSSEEDASDSPLAADQGTREAAAVSPTEDSRYRALGGFVARKYRVSQDRAYDLVRLAHGVGHQVGLDPLLIIAVIAIESRFNPIAESMSGAQGLMQIIPKYHTAKFLEYGGEKAAFDPEANVKVGARILKEYIRLTGNLGIALQMYAGALGDGEDEYTTKVMNEQQRLKQVLVPASRPGPTRPAATTATPATPPSNDPQHLVQASEVNGLAK